MRELRAVPLSLERAALAYPLIQIVRPSMNFAAWKSRVRAILLEDSPSRPAGITTLEDPGGLILGLFVYRVERGIGHDPALVAEDFVAVDIVSGDAVARVLADALEAVARHHGCRAVHTAIACSGGSNARQMVELLARLGHRVESFHLCKPLQAAG